MIYMNWFAAKITDIIPQGKKTKNKKQPPSHTTQNTNFNLTKIGTMIHSETLKK